MIVACAAAVPTHARTRLRVAALDAWSALGVALVEQLVAEAWRDIAEASRRLLRIAQAVRLAILLARRLGDPGNPAFQPVPARPRAARADAAEACASAPRGVDGAREKPTRPAGPVDREISDDAILRRPLRDIVKLICRALGLVPDWSLWDEAEEGLVAAAAALDARARPKPSPPPLLQGRFLRRVLGRGPVGPRASFRFSASPLVLDPLAAR